MTPPELTITVNRKVAHGGETIIMTVDARDEETPVLRVLVDVRLDYVMSCQDISWIEREQFGKNGTYTLGPAGFCGFQPNSMSLTYTALARSAGGDTAFGGP